MSALDHKPLPLLLRPGINNAFPHSDNCSPQKKNLLHYSKREGSGFDPTCCYLIFFLKMQFFPLCCPRSGDTVATYLQTACPDGGRLTFATVGVA